MKFAWTVLAALLLAHALAVALLVSWLGWTGRLDADRARRAVEVFRVSVSQERALQEQAERLAAETREKALDAARLEKVAAGPLTLQDRLRAEEAADEIANQRVERLRVETKYLREQLEQYKRLLGEQQAALAAEREAFEAAAAEIEERRLSEDFQQAVALYERLKPRQAKEMFQTLMKDGRTGEVVEYLAAMQLRATAGVLKEFKTPEEVAQATDLVQRLRERGVDPGDPPAARPQIIGGGAT